MGRVGTLHVIDNVGVIRVDSPPVNALSATVRIFLEKALRRFAADDAAQAILIICGGRTFFAGADISEFGKPLQGPDLNALFRQIEQICKPVVAALHGTALGGGLELALACHYRLAAPSAKLGLPEVHLGLLPGAGGTQRLPRIVGIDIALELITSGRTITAGEALRLGILDVLSAEESLQSDALAYARAQIGKVVQRTRDRQEKIDQAKAHPDLFDDFRRRNSRAFRGFKAPELIVQALEAAIDLPFDKGLAREHELFEMLQGTTESRAQRAYFFAERESSKVPGLSAKAAPIASVGVVGAGTMGAGIAMNFLNAGIPVTIVETRHDALERGIATIRRNYEASAKRGRLSLDEVERRMALLTSSLQLEDLAASDLVIEAVFEEMSLKQDIFRRLDGIAKAGAILASNTSFLDLDVIADATSRPDAVIGLHFFSPANIMRLLEVVRGRKTADSVVATAMVLAKRIGKIPVLSGVCPGFIANRIMAARGAQADALILEGASPIQVDNALQAYGFPMGHFAMMDLVGLDVIGRGATGRSVAGDLVALGRLGQKHNGGYYDYDDTRKATPSPTANATIASIAADLGVAQRTSSLEQMIERLLYPVVNEGAKLLSEGVALRASDIDVAAILGYGWPVYTGGPMFWADTIGLPKIIGGLKKLEAYYGEAFKPAPLLESLAAAGRGLTRD